MSGSPVSAQQPTQPLAQISALLGWLILASSAITVVFGALPLRVLSASWYLTNSANLLNVGLLALIGALLVSISQLLEPADKAITRAAGRLRAIATTLVVLYLLLLPLQIVLGQRVVKGSDREILASVDRLTGLVKGIEATQSEEALRAYLSSLPDPPTLPARFDAPFEVVKTRALTNLKARIYAESNLYARRNSRNTLQFFIECIRNGLQCLVLAIGFAAIVRLTAAKGVNPLNAALLRLARLPARALRSSR